MINYFQIVKQIKHIPRKYMDNVVLMIFFGKKEINSIFSLFLEEKMLGLKQE
jgi:hypothetical protein